MKIETFKQKLLSGKGVGHKYQVDGKTGLIDIWRHESKFVFTWEEFMDGTFYDEQDYTRDEVHQFKDIEGVLDFLRANKVNPRVFSP